MNKNAVIFVTDFYAQCKNSFALRYKEIRDALRREIDLPTPNPSHGRGKRNLTYFYTQKAPYRSPRALALSAAV
jgi:hypothetical protein